MCVMCAGPIRYLFGIGAVLLLSGTLLFIHRPEWGMMPGWLMAGGVVTAYWLAENPLIGSPLHDAGLFAQNHVGGLTKRRLAGWRV